VGYSRNVEKGLKAEDAVKTRNSSGKEGKKPGENRRQGQSATQQERAGSKKRGSHRSMQRTTQAV